MKARDIVGKTVLRVEQQRTNDDSGNIVWHVERIIFTDGTVLRLSVAELPSDYAVEGTTYKKQKGESDEDSSDVGN